MSCTIFRARFVKTRARCVHDADRVPFCRSLKYATKLTDSQIVLHWINSKDIPLKQWVRNREIEINRFSKPEDWYYVNTKDIADIGTRRGAKVEDVNQDSEWINGFKWMKSKREDFPVVSFTEMKLNHNERKEVSKESSPLPIAEQEQPPLSFVSSTSRSNQSSEITKRYQYSNYLIDPNQYRYQRVIRIMALVIRFVVKLKSRRGKSDTNQRRSIIVLSDSEIRSAEQYFFRKATLEVKKFNQVSRYEKISKEKDTILYYTGRILPEQEFNTVGSMSKVMKDLTSTTFCVPLIDKHSPLGYSIVNEIHWYDASAKHSGIETLWRYTLKKCFIIEGREVVKKVKKLCQRCRYLGKKNLEVTMGPLTQTSLSIAPAFYNTQADLAGPFKAYSRVNKRTTLKIWLIGGMRVISK